MNRNEQRFELAKAAMQGLLSNHFEDFHNLYGAGAVASWAIAYADALLAELDRTAPKEPTDKQPLNAPDSDGWIPHVPGDAMPCDPGIEVICKFPDGEISTGEPASFWGETPGNRSAWSDLESPEQIIAWKPA